MEVFFIKDLFDTLDYESIKQTHSNNQRLIEESINCVDFTDLINWDLANEEFIKFVNEVSGLWKAKLSKDYPGRTFNIQVVDFSEGGNWGILFSEIINK